jgi:hypothetical protein
VKTCVRCLNIFVRSFIVALCFIIDVKVKADVVVEAVKGQAEFERNHEILSRDRLAKLPSQFDAQELDVQTFEGGSVRFLLSENRVGMGQSSILSVRKDQIVNFPTGIAFFAVSKKSGGLKIQTPQGSVGAAAAEFLLDVNDGKTKVSVLSGTVELKDRAAEKKIKINSGYCSWLGGLQATGQHANPVRPEAFEMQNVMEQARPLMGWSDKEYQGRVDTLTPVWKDAVVKVGEESQLALDKDIKTLNQILKNEKDFEDKKNREQAKLRSLFKAKTVGLPGESTEAPSGLNRDPAGEQDPLSDLQGLKKRN